MRNNKSIKCIITLTLVIIFFFNKNESMPNVEEEDIHVGTGYSIDKRMKDLVDYSVLLSAYVFKENSEIETVGHTGVGTTIGQTRQDRQVKNPRKFTVGFEKVYLIDEEYAAYGIRNILDIVFKNPMINTDGFCLVCKGNSKDYLNQKSVGYNSSADFINEMITNIQKYSFYGKHYRLKDLFLIVDSEGRNAVLPYIEINEGKIELKGMGLFNKYKLVKILNIEETKIMNILRENNVRGMLTIQKNSKEYINYYAKSTKEVLCTKEGDKYKFLINIKLKGDVINNKLYSGMLSDMKEVEKFEEDMAKNLEKEANIFIEKMKKNYKIDCLELGRIATAKYGRESGKDWNELIINSDIKVNVKVNVDKIGRGEY